MPQLIKELRFGRAKVGKTKNVVESYPKPMLVLSYDKGGTDSVSGCNLIPVTDRSQLKALVEGELKGDEVFVIEYRLAEKSSISKLATVGVSRDPAAQAIEDLNVLLYSEKLQIKTVVLDTLTSLGDMVLEFILVLDGKLAPTLPVWGMITAKEKEVLNKTLTLGCNVVVCAHECVDKDELTGELRITPLAHGSQFREQVANLFSQVFHADVEIGADGKLRFIVHTSPRGNIKGVGARWPQGLPPVCGPRYEEIYGK